MAGHGNHWRSAADTELQAELSEYVKPPKSSPAVAPDKVWLWLDKRKMQRSFLSY